MLQENAYKIIFHPIGECFQLLKRRLFVDQWLQESTRLIIAFVNETENPRQMFFFENLNSEDDTVEAFDLSEYKEYALAIDGYMHSKEYAEKNIRKELKEFELSGCTMRAWYICVSPCLNGNFGKFLLGQAFLTMVESLRDWCLQLQELKWENGELQKPSVDNWSDFVQGILQMTYKRVVEQLEDFYSPVKIPYIISLSGEYYERTENSSNLLFLPKLNDADIEASKLEYDFRKENSRYSDILFVPENIRRIRKLTQMASGNLYLVLQIQPKEKEYDVLGICQKDSIKSLLQNQTKDVPYFICRAKGHMKWDLYLGDWYIFSFINGDYRITWNMPIEYLENRCKNIFPNRKVNLTRVYKNICEAQKQPHGTMLVILSEKHAKSESLRFYERNVGMRDAIPRVRTNVLNNLDSIDGSILIDIKGKVHSIGVILDGDSNVIGKPERGARYNSALKYCGFLQRAKMPGLILIVSEDGSIDMIDTNTSITRIDFCR